MKKASLLSILFSCLSLLVQAQTDSLKQKKWNFNVGVINGVTQSLFSKSANYQMKDYSGVTYAIEGYFQYNFSRKVAVSLGMRYGKRTTNTYFQSNEGGFITHTDQNLLELPLMLGYKLLNAQGKEVINIEAGVLLGGLLDNSSVQTIYDSKSLNNNFILIVGGEAGSGLSGGYRSGVIRLSKSFPLFTQTQLKFLLGYDLSTYYVSHMGIGIEYHNLNTNYYRFENIKLRYQAFYIGASLTF